MEMEILIISSEMKFKSGLDFVSYKWNSEHTLRTNWAVQIAAAVSKLGDMWFSSWSGGKMFLKLSLSFCLYSQRHKCPYKSIFREK